MSMRNVRKSRRAAMAAIAAAAAAGMLLAGCATTVSGTAQIGSDTPGAVVSSNGNPDSGSAASAAPSSANPLTDGPPSSDAPTPSDAQPSSGAPSTSDGSPPSPTSDDQGSSSAPPDSTSAGTSGPPAGDLSVYPIKPRHIEKNPSSPQEQSLVEGRRLAAYVPVPTAIDPQYSEGGDISTLPLKGPTAMGILFTDPVPAVAQRAGMYAGFSSAQSTFGHTGSLLTAAFVFPDAAAATKAALSLSAAAKSKGDKPLAIPGQPKALASISAGTEPSAQAFLAIGPVVGYVYVSAKAGKTAAFPSTAAKALAAEAKLLAAYTPTPKAKLATLLEDPDGVLGRTLPELAGNGTVVDGSWTPTAFLHYMIGYASSAALFSKIKVDAVAVGRSTVYRAADHPGALELAVTNVQQIAGTYPKMKPYPTPGGTADTTCVADNLGAKYYCSGAVGRYTFEYWADSEADMAHSVASQVTVLTA
ncbi:MAG: hypothetical protein M3Z00_01415 [Actinomycetota bacterium]|nr:hypothetical protein [Actinomycetota bacterium]